MNVREALLGFQENWSDSVLDQLSIVDDSEYSLLAQLDIARKCLDVELGDQNGSGWDHTNAYVKRVLLHTLRKYSEPITLTRKDGLSSIYGFVDLNNLHGQLEQRIDVGRLTTFSYQALLKANAMRGFLHRNDSVQRFIPKYLAPLMRSFLLQALDGFHEEFINSPAHFGPGAVEEGLTSFERWHWMGRNPYWCPISEDLSSWSIPNQDAARLHAVAKDWNKQRLITVEPYENTYLQHKIRHAMSRTLVRNGLGKLALQGDSGMDVPAIHRQLCRESSARALSKDARIDSMDLSDASDSISWEAVVSVFPWEVVVELERARSPNFSFRKGDVNWGQHEIPDWDIDEIVSTPISGGGDVLTREMHIFAGMGNSTTFLVESLYFYALLQAVSTYYRIPNRKAQEISVFGDDLITPTGYDELYKQSLAEAGFRLNTSKSFCGTSTVRESCGMWAYRGENLYVLPYKGYSSTASGKLGLAEYLRNASWVVRETFLSRVKDWPNTPKPIPNTISVVDEDREISWEYSRYSSKRSGREWFLKTARSATYLHLCVRRGGAYMMISRVPSEEGLSKDVLLVEALAQPEALMEQFLGLVIELRTPIPQSRTRQNRELATGIMEQAGLMATSKIVVTWGLCEVCRTIGELNRHVRKPNMFRTMKFLFDLIGGRVKPDTAEIEHLRDRFRIQVKACGYPIKVIRSNLKSRVKVLEETIPHSTTLRSSWVSMT